MLNLFKKSLKIEKVTSGFFNEVSYCPERGGIITSLKFGGKEILYFNKNTFENLTLSVRGGIPILFPNFGPINDPKYPDLKQHGFARTSSKWISEKITNGFKETLIADEDSLKSYPYHFELTINGKFEDNKSFTITQEVKNLENDKEMPISMGLHPYLKTPANKKGDIKFDFDGGRFIEEQVNAWANGKDTAATNPNTPMKIIIPNLGTVTIDASPEYRKIWIWSIAENDFVCVEPVMRKKNGLVEDPQMIKPGETFSASVNFSFKK
jgi:galactose mutarotase-like enzyme